MRNLGGEKACFRQRGGVGKRRKTNYGTPETTKRGICFAEKKARVGNGTQNIREKGTQRGKFTSNGVGFAKKRDERKGYKISGRTRRGRPEKAGFAEIRGGLGEEGEKKMRKKGALNFID